jgi:hypothetical protein
MSDVDRKSMFALGQSVAYIGYKEISFSFLIEGQLTLHNYKELLNVRMD